MNLTSSSSRITTTVKDLADSLKYIGLCFLKVNSDYIIIRLTIMKHKGWKYSSIILSKMMSLIIC